jgi:outer membrane protein assembly factor BamA
VRPHLLAVLALASCRTAPSGYAPVAAPCASHRIGAVTVHGAPRHAVPQLAVLEGTIDDPGRIARTASTAIGSLRARGFARASLAVTRRTGCHIDLDVAVTLGPHYRIADIAFETDDAFPLAERLAVIEDALGTVNTIGGVYIEYRMKRALAELERRYRDAGWLEAELGEPRASYDPLGRVSVAVRIDAGPRFRIASVRAIGAGARARDAVLQMLGLRAGDYYDGPRIRTAIARARHRLARWVELRTRVAGDRPEIDLEAILEARDAAGPDAQVRSAGR